MEGLLTRLHASKRSAELYLQVFIDTYKVRAPATGSPACKDRGSSVDPGWVANFRIRTPLGWPLHVYRTGKQVRDILKARRAER